MSPKSQWVVEVNPEKQGLKHFLSVLGIGARYRVVEVNPEKQGLKPTRLVS